MLSYMLPMDEKNSLLPNKEHLQLNLETNESPSKNLTNGKISTDSHIQNKHSQSTPQTVAAINNNDGPVTTITKTTVMTTGGGGLSSSVAATCGNILKKPLFNSASITSSAGTFMMKTNCTTTGSSSVKYHHLNNQTATNTQQGNISKESSVSSCLSDATTASSMTPTSTISSDKPKAKILANGGSKHTTLKRVSFGSSKGSMVETLIYESPLQEEPENSPIAERPCPTFPTNTQESSDSTELERAKVRVSFFQQSRPQQISPINSTENLVHLDIPMATTANVTPPGPLSATATITDINGHLQYNRQESTDSGWDNPFRPGGELSREAEEIVELIKGGKPITPTPDSSAPPLPSVDEADNTIHSGGTSPTATPASTVDATSPLTQSPKKVNNLSASPNKVATNQTTTTEQQNNALNGNASVNSKQPGAVDVKRDTVNSPGEAEHVVLKKKPKCKCCVIQ